MHAFDEEDFFAARFEFDEKGAHLMTKRPYTRKTTSPRVDPPAKPKPFVVYVTFPNSHKEYCYWCDLPNIRQGSTVVANGAEVTVRRTAEVDPAATKWVQSRSAFDIARRRNAIIQELIKLEERESQMARFRRLKSPEAKRLLTELESLA